MSPALHLLKFDVRHNRLLLIVWALLLALQCSLALVETSHLGNTTQVMLTTLAQIVPVLQLIISAVLIPQIVQSQALVGTTAFWLTKPIARSQLLKSKALAIGLLVLLPVLAQMLVLLTLHVTPADCALAFVEQLLRATSLALIIASLAALTPNFARYAIAAVILFVSMRLIRMLIFYVGTALFNTTLWNIDLRVPGLSSSRVLTDCLVTIAGLAAVMVYQYYSRRTRRNVIAALCIAALSLLISSLWPWSYFAAAKGRELPEQNADQIKFSLLNSNFYERSSSFNEATALSRDLYASYSVSGTHASVECTVKCDTTLRTSEGKTIEASPPAQPIGYPSESQVIGPIEEALGNCPLVNRRASYATGFGCKLLSMRDEDYKTYGNRPLTLETNFNVTTCTYTIETILPLKEGAAYTRKSTRTELSEISLQEDAVSLTLSQRKVNLLLRPQTEPDEYDYVYVLRNRRLNQALTRKQQGSPLFRFPNLNVMGTDVLTRGKLTLTYGQESYNPCPTLNSAWLKDAELVILRRVPVGKFTRHLVVKNFSIGRPEDSLRSKEKPAPYLSKAREDAIAALKLSSQPSKQEIREFLEAYQLLVPYGTHTQEDPRYKKLLSIGPGHVDTLLEVIRRVPRNWAGGAYYYFENALLKLAQPEDKTLILGALDEHHNLVSLVTKYHWSTDVRETLLTPLKDPTEKDLPADWLRAVLDLKDASLNPLLLNYLKRSTNWYRSYVSIKKAEGISFDDTLSELWAKSKDLPLGERIDLAVISLDCGKAEAIPVLLKLFDEELSTSQRNHILRMLRQHSSARGDVEKVRAWFARNLAELQYDRAFGKFLTSAERAAPQNVEPAPAEEDL